MPVILPFQPSIGRYRFNTTIGGRVYVFRVHWNPRDTSTATPDGAWYFDVYELADQATLTPIIFGVKIVRGTYLGRTSQHPLFTEGVMVARALVPGDPSEAGFDTIGSRVHVRYYTFAEMINEIASQQIDAVSGPIASGDSVGS